MRKSLDSSCAPPDTLQPLNLGIYFFCLMVLLNLQTFGNLQIPTKALTLFLQNTQSALIDLILILEAGQ